MVILHFHEQGHDAIHEKKRGAGLPAETVTINPPNSLVLVVTSARGQVPSDFPPGEIVAATRHALAIGTAAEHDRATTLTLTTVPMAPLREDLFLLWDGELEAEEGYLAVETVLGEQVLLTPVAATQVRVRAWASDRTEPDTVVVEAFAL